MTPVQWTAIMLITTGVIYALTAGAYWFSGRPGMTLAFVGYALANVGFVIDATGGK